MCYFITVGVGERGAGVAKELLGAATGFEVQRNKSVWGAVGSRFGATVTLSKGAGCCCGLFHGGSDRREGLRRKYEKKGWSQAKIERAVAAATADDFQGLAESVRRVVAEIAERVGEVVVLVHWYSAGVDQEALVPRGTIEISSEELKRGDPVVEEDYLYLVKSGIDAA